jgi:hypothetical protein
MVCDSLFVLECHGFSHDMLEPCHFLISFGVALGSVDDDPCPQPEEESGLHVQKKSAADPQV